MSNPEPEPYENVDAWCAEHEGCDADVVVSGHLVHTLLIDAGLPLDGEDALQAYARHQFMHYHGAAAQDWPLAHWSEGSQRGACALHGLDLGAVRQHCAAHDVHLRSVRPAWSVVLQSASRQAPGLASDACTALAVVDGALVTWLLIESGQLRALQQRFAASHDATDIAQLLDRLVTECAPLPAPPVIVGWAVAAPLEGVAWPGKPIGRLDGPAPAAHWLMATRRAQLP